MQSKSAKRRKTRKTISKLNEEIEKLRVLLADRVLQVERQHVAHNHSKRPLPSSILVGSEPLCVRE